MRLPVIKHLVAFAEINDEDYLKETVEVLEDLIDARGIKDEELETIGELISNLYGALEVYEDVNCGMPLKEALNNFMKKVTSIGQ